jgi:Fic family protein
MSSRRTIERLIADAEQRLRLANQDLKKIQTELKELRHRLEEAELAEQQLALPLGSRARGLSDKWAIVLNFMVLRAPNPISIDEIAVFVSDNKLDISRAAIRAQLHHYEKRGFVERVSDGLYLATSAARAYCDY